VETASEVGKTAMEIAEKAFAVVKGAAVGAIEGAKGALKEEKKEEEQKQ
jgi:hypothetical protein